MANINPIHSASDSASLKPSEKTTTSKSGKNLHAAFLAQISSDTKPQLPPPSSETAIQKSVNDPAVDKISTKTTTHNDLVIEPSQSTDSPAKPVTSTDTPVKPLTSSDTPIKPLTSSDNTSNKPVATAEKTINTKNTKIQVASDGKVTLKSTNGQHGEVTVYKGNVTDTQKSGTVISVKPEGTSGNKLVTITQNGKTIELVANSAKKEITTTVNGITTIYSGETMSEFEKSHPDLKPNTQVELLSGKQITGIIQVNAIGVERIIEPGKVIIKLPNGGNSYTFENSATQGLVVSVNNGKFVPVGDPSVNGAVTQNSDGSYHLTGASVNIGANLGHITDTSQTNPDGSNLSYSIGQSQILSNNQQLSELVQFNRSTGAFSVVSTSGNNLFSFNAGSGAISTSDFTLSSSGSVSFGNDCTVMANGNIINSAGDVILNSSTDLGSNPINTNNPDVTNATSFDNNPDFDKTTTLGNAVDGIVNHIDAKISTGNITPADINGLQQSLGSLDNALSIAQATHNIALISDITSCQAMLINVLGQAESALKVDTRKPSNIVQADFKPKNNFDHKAIIDMHNNNQFSQTARLLYA